MSERKQPIRESGFSGERLPKELFEVIGEIIVRWSYVEFQLAVILREGFNISKKTGNALITGKDIGVQCGVLRTLSRSQEWIKDEALRKEIEALAKAVEKHKDDRHDYAHGVFHFNVKSKDEPVFSRYLNNDKTNRINPQSKKVNFDELREIAETARDLGIRAQDLTVKIKRWKQSAGLRRPA